MQQEIEKLHHQHLLIRGLNMKTFFTLLFLLIAGQVNAEMWINYNISTLVIEGRRIGDCKKLGICSGFNNSGVSLGWFEAVKNEYDNAGLSNKKVDLSQSVGNRIIDKTQAELDAEVAAEQSKIDAAEALRVSNLDDKISAAKTSDANLIKIDASIDAINNLADAKAWLKKLARYLVQ